MNPRNILSRAVEAVMRRLGRYSNRLGNWAWRYGARRASERRRLSNTPWDGGIQRREGEWEVEVEVLERDIARLHHEIIRANPPRPMGGDRP